MKHRTSSTLRVVLTAVVLFLTHQRDGPASQGCHRQSAGSGNPGHPTDDYSGKIADSGFAYELLPNFRDQLPGNAAVSYHCAMMMLSERRLPDPKKAMEHDRKIDEFLEKPLKDVPIDEMRGYVQSDRQVFRELELGKNASIAIGISNDGSTRMASVCCCPKSRRCANWPEC